MNYLRCLLSNVAAVFFANYLLPGIEILGMSKLPHIQGDLWFPLIVGLLNSLIVPALKGADTPLHFSKIIVFACAISFSAYAVIKFVPIGVEVTTLEGYLFASLFVSIVAFATNFMSLKKVSGNPLP